MQNPPKSKASKAHFAILYIVPCLGFLTALSILERTMLPPQTMLIFALAGGVFVWHMLTRYFIASHVKSHHKTEAYHLRHTFIWLMVMAITVHEVTYVVAQIMRDMGAKSFVLPVAILYGVIGAMVASHSFRQAFAPCMPRAAP